VFLALFCAKFVGLGAVLENFFSVASIDMRDAKTVVDGLMESEGKGNGMAVPPQSIGKDDITFLKKILRKYGPDDAKAWVCFGWTMLYFAASLYSLHFHPSWWSVMLSSAFVVRGFIVFHDACHNSFFRSPTVR